MGGKLLRWFDGDNPIAKHVSGGQKIAGRATVWLGAGVAAFGLLPSILILVVDPGPAARVSLIVLGVLNGLSAVLAVGSPIAAAVATSLLVRERIGPGADSQLRVTTIDGETVVDGSQMGAFKRLGWLWTVVLGWIPPAFGALTMLEAMNLIRWSCTPSPIYSSFMNCMTRNEALAAGVSRAALIVLLFLMVLIPTLRLALLLGVRSAFRKRGATMSGIGGVLDVVGGVLLVAFAAWIGTALSRVGLSFVIGLNSQFVDSINFLVWLLVALATGGGVYALLLRNVRRDAVRRWEQRSAR